MKSLFRREGHIDAIDSPEQTVLAVLRSVLANSDKIYYY